MLTTSEFLSITNNVQKAYGQAINQVAAKNGMTKVEMDVLLFLSNNPQYNTAKEIVEVRNIVKSYVSKAVDLLVKRGYLLVEADPADRRIGRLSIQDSAQEVLRQAKTVQESVVKNIFQGITKEELQAFESILCKMEKNIEKDRRGGR